MSKKEKKLSKKEIKQIEFMEKVEEIEEELMKKFKKNIFNNEELSLHIVEQQLLNACYSDLDSIMVLDSNSGNKNFKSLLKYFEWVEESLKYLLKKHRINTDAISAEVMVDYLMRYKQILKFDEAIKFGARDFIDISCFYLYDECLKLFKKEIDELIYKYVTCPQNNNKNKKDNKDNIEKEEIKIVNETNKELEEDSDFNFKGFKKKAKEQNGK